jgi:hypothetical protein
MSDNGSIIGRPRVLLATRIESRCQLLIAFMSRQSFVFLLAMGASLAVVACGGGEPGAPPVATPTVTFKSSRVPLGSPVEVTYKFQVAANAPKFDDNYRVLVHYLDADDEMMWADDHEPAIPTTQWKPGQVIEYTRTSFVPVYQYVGQASVHVGLYSRKTQKRLPLAGQHAGQLEYRVASIQLLPTSENVFVLFKDGWHPSETAPDNSGIEWQWTKKVATLAFRNPRKPTTFYLDGDNSSGLAGPQTIQVKVNGHPVDTIAVAPKTEFLHKTQLTTDQLGTGDMVEVSLDVDKTFVPALNPSANNRDARELGVRIFHAFVEPKS